VKAALLAAVLNAVRGRVERDGNPDRKEKLLNLVKRLVLRVKWLPAMRMIAAAGLKSHTDLTPEQIALLSSPLLTSGLEEKQEEALKKTAEDGKPVEEPVSLGAFRETFAELMNEIDTNALVVLVDDLDRCLPDTIIHVFEAMRLFLHAPKTAFVVAADQRIVQAAVEHAYPEAVKADSRISTDYLEKILQLTISIPPLSVADSETYTNLLMAQANTTPEAFAKLVEKAKQQRAKANLAVAMNHGIARETLGEVDEKLGVAFAIAGRIAPALAPTHQGNPRQIKRFLNLYQLRQRAAARRGVELDPATLAKLMVLETVSPVAYRTLFEWQAVSAGKPVELSRAEAGGDDLDEPVKAWATLPAVADWLKLEPPLKDVDLGPYFFFSRDRLTPALPAARLNPELQAVLTELRSDTEGIRSAAVDKALSLEPADITAVYAQLLPLASRAPGSLEMKSATAMAARNPAIGDAFRDALLAIPAKDVPVRLAMQLKVAFGGKVDGPVLKPVFDEWAKEPGLKKVVNDARENTGKGN
jgi:hypothetical protein